MTRFTRITRTLTAVICAAIVAGVAAVSASAGSTVAPARLSPAGNVYTCSWISKHSTAAASAGVTCNPVVFLMETGAAAQVGTTQVDASPTTVTATGNLCNYIPASGKVGQGVYAWSNYEYADYWNFSDYSSPYNYEWYLQKLDGTNQYHDSYSGSGFDSIHEEKNLGYTNRRWGGHNLSSTAAYWYVCHD